MMRGVLTGVALASVAAAVSSPAAPAQIIVDNRLTFTRPDGSAIVFPPRVRVWCGRWEPGVSERALHVRVGGRRGGWQLRAVVADVRRDPVVDLPHSFVWRDPSEAQLFATDLDNELSTAEEEASGRITFGRARCGRRLVVRVRIDAVLGSEFFEGDEWRVRGSFSARR
jgi:hypothetical protein